MPRHEDVLRGEAPAFDFEHATRREKRNTKHEAGRGGGGGDRVRTFNKIARTAPNTSSEKVGGFEKAAKRISVRVRIG